MNPYDLLGVSPTASLPEIQARYRLLLREYHPDLHQDESPDQLAAAEAMTRNLNLAIEMLRGSPLRHDHSYRERPEPGRQASGGAQWAGDNPFWQAPGPCPPPDDVGSDSYRKWFGNPANDTDPVPCPFCGRHYERLDDYELHLEQVHRYRSRPAAAPRRKAPGSVLRVIGRLRFVPTWMTMLLAISVWIMIGHVAFTVALGFVALVLWTQTSPRFKD